MELQVGDVIKMKKQHPCGENRWKLVRVGMDIKMILKTVLVVLKGSGSK